MFNGINQEEYNVLKEAIPVITVLIAGADGVIDTKETEWASKVTDIRAYAYKEVLRDFYSEAGKEFEKKMKVKVEEFNADIEKSRAALKSHLSHVNRILPKLDNEIGHHLYESLVSFAEHVAKASGGFLRFGTISREEKSLIGLPMLDPIPLEELDAD